MPLHPQPRFVLVNTSHPGNVGAAARSIKVMGFGDLVLVGPRHSDVLSHPQAVAMASGAGEVLAGARVVQDLASALEGVQQVCATAMTPRDFGPPVAAPRPHLQAQATLPDAPRIAFVFGSERHGLGNDDVYRAHHCLSIPTHQGYGSLNLAQAVQVIAYEYRQALGGFEPPPAPDCLWADAASVEAALQHWQQALEDVGYLDPRAPKKLMPRLQRLLNRLQLAPEEVHILRGIARAVQQAAESRPASPGGPQALEPSTQGRPKVPTGTGRPAGTTLE